MVAGEGWAILIAPPIGDRGEGIGLLDKDSNV